MKGLYFVGIENNEPYIIYSKNYIFLDDEPYTDLYYEDSTGDKVKWLDFPTDEYETNVNCFYSEEKAKEKYREFCKE